MRIFALLSVALMPILAWATPSANNFHAVTNDWYQGNWSNVYELAQMRLAANTNDVVAAYIMRDYDLHFSDFTAMSNSVLRLIHAGEAVTLPAYTNKFVRYRQSYETFLSDVLPGLSEEFRIQEQKKSYTPHMEMLSSQLLKILWEGGLWEMPGNEN